MNLKLFLVPLLLVATTTCSSGHPTQKLSLIDSKVTPDVSEEERLRRMQMVRVLDEAGNVAELESWTFWDAVGVMCGWPTCTAMTLYSCDRSVCGAADNYCEGEVYAALAGLVPKPIVFKNLSINGGPPKDWTVPPQTSATNAKLLEQSRVSFLAAISEVTEALSGIPETNTPARCSNTELVGPYRNVSGGQRRSAMLGAVFRDSYTSALQSTRGEAEADIAVADAQKADAPSFQLSQARSMAGSGLSRSAAAHVYLGGVPGLAGDTTSGLCNATRLGGPAKKALDIMRQAAPLPADVLNPDVTTSRLVDDTGGATAPTQGTVRARLNYFLKTTLPTNFSVWDFYGLSLADFEQARQTMQDEFAVFARSQSARWSTLPPGYTPTFWKYAATASPPPERDPAYWMAIARTSNRDSNKIGNDWFWDEPRVYNAPTNLFIWISNFARVVDIGHTISSYYLGALTSSVPAQDTILKSDILAPMATIAASDDLQGRLTQCAKLDNTVTITAWGISNTAGAMLVQGEDRLECATKGNVEGAPCLLDIAYPLTTLATGMHEFNQGARMSASNSVLFPGGKAARWYLITPRQPGQTSPGPGGYVSLAGFVPYLLPEGTTDPELCRNMPLSREAMTLAAKALAPSPEWCGKSQVECAGTRFDERLPLEDELSEDNDGVESSWKHYLALARRSADQADALGQAYVQASVQVDENTLSNNLRALEQQEKAAGELQTLQAVCGTDVDPGVLLKSLNSAAGQYDLGKILDGNCTGGVPSNSDSYCVNGKAVVKWTKLLGKDAQSQKLAQCLDSFSGTQQMHLGDTALCQAPDKTITLAQSNCNSNACPSGNTCIPKSKGLGLFNSRSIYPLPAEGLCDNIRQLRKDTSSIDSDGVSLIEKLIQSKAFTLSNLRDVGQSTSIQLDFGGYVSVHAGGAGYSTGSPSSGPPTFNANTPWPCGTAGMPAVCTANTGSGLFCSSWDCTDIAQRAQANYRLYNAALATKLLTWSAQDPVPNVPIPALLNKMAFPKDARYDRSAVRVDGYGVDVWTNDTWTTYDTFLGDPIPTTSPAARCAHTLGAPAGSSCIDSVNPKYQFSVQTIPVDAKRATIAASIGDLADLSKHVWTGMAPGPEGGRLENRLRGQDWQTMPPVAFNLTPSVEISVAANSYSWWPTCSGSTCSNVPGSNFNALGLTTTSAHGSSSLDAAFSSHYNPADNGGHGPGYDNYRVSAGPLRENQPSGTWDLNSTYGEQAALDSIELICDAMSRSDDSLSSACGSGPPTVSTVRDLDALGGYLQCLGDAITRRAVTALFENVPTSVVTELNRSGTSNKASGGDLDLAKSDARGAIQAIADTGPVLGGTIRRFGQELKALRSRLTSYDIADKIEDVQLNSQIVQQVTNCIVGAADAANLASPFTKWAAGAATCANSAAQIAFAVKLNELHADANTAARQEAISEFGGRFSDAVTAMQEQSTRLSKGLEDFYKALSTIETAKAKARLAVDNALWLLSNQAAGQVQLTNALKSISIGDRIRYQRALVNARRTAFLAKRAIEQRLGVALEDMPDNLPLVAAPATWAPKVCTTSGINFKALENSGLKGAQQFADGFIGDYVTKLENVVESYRLTNNFHEGSDTAVVSLRDDVLHTSQKCSVESPNLLLNASNLGMAGLAVSSRPGWHIDGCAVGAAPDNIPLQNCLAV
ncbi:MAG TPA: hypothetical protein VER11_08490, partial [Polyangiaceae bacterium]|nr:hypothetical protein [Polyangiaceae bacterium]